MAQELLFDSLYTSKLHDSGNEYTEKDYNKFIKQLNASFPKGTIDFSSQQIGMSALTKLTKVLRTAPHIRKFNFYGNMITDHGLHSLFQLLLINPRIEVVDIGCNGMSNQGVPVLQDIILKTKITSLQLGIHGVAWHRNMFTTAAMADILDAILKGGTIQCLGLSGIQMSIRQGARRISIAEKFAEFIRNCTQLKSISLSDCGFTPSDEDFVFTKGLAMNPRLVYIECSENWLGDPIGPAFCKSVQNMTSLRRINLSKCFMSDDAGLALAESLKKSKLISLDISHNSIGTAGMRAILSVLKDNIYLTELSASYNSFNEDIAETLHDIVRYNNVLAYIDISHNNLSDKCAFAIAEYLSTNDSIVSINLSTCKITRDGAIAIAEAIVPNKTLTSISLADNFLTRDEGYALIEILKNNEILREIDLTSTQIDHFVIQASRDICNRNKQIQYEENLQPLKKEMIQLSIQRTKIPEAKARLSDLMEQYEDTADKIEQTNQEYLEYVHKVNRNIEDLERQIHSKKGEIDQNEKEIVNMTVNGEKTAADAEQQYYNTTMKIETTKNQIIQYEAQMKEIENNIQENNKTFEEEKAKLLKQIEEEKQKAKEIREIMNDEEKLMAYEPPEGMDIDPLFIVDQVDRMASSGRKSSRSKASKKSKNSRTKRKESPKQKNSNAEEKTKRSSSPKKQKKSNALEERPKTPEKESRE